MTDPTGPYRTAGSRTTWPQQVVTHHDNHALRAAREASAGDTRPTQTPHDTEAPGGGRPTFGHASVRRNGHDGDAGRSAASLAETAAPVPCPDDICRAQGSCAWDCGGRKYVP